MKYNLETGENKIENKGKIDFDSLLDSPSLGEIMKGLIKTVNTCFGAFQKFFPGSILGGNSIDYFKNKIMDDCKNENFAESNLKSHKRILPAEVHIENEKFVAYDEHGYKIKGEDGVTIIDSLGGSPTYNIYIFKNNDLIFIKENSTIPVYNKTPKKYNILKGSL